MKRIFLLALALPTALLAGKADPGAALIAADDAYARAASEDGEWTATRAVSLPQSEMFVPERVKILEFGKDRPDSEAATRWRAEQAWISCDGTAGVTFGRWSLPGTNLKGWYEAVWGQMRDGSYRMLLRKAGSEPRKVRFKNGRKGVRAACTGKPFLAVVAPAEGDDFKFGASNDMTLTWSSLVTGSGEVQIAVRLWDGQDFQSVLEHVAPAPASR